MNDNQKEFLEYFLNARNPQDANIFNSEFLTALNSLIKERDELKTKYKELENSIKNWGIIELGIRNINISSYMNDREEELADIKDKCTQLEAKCAEMREALQRIADNAPLVMPKVGYDQLTGQHDTQFVPRRYVKPEIAHALSSDCGKGFVRVEELSKTEEVIKVSISRLFNSKVIKPMLESELVRIQQLIEKAKQ